MARVVDFSPSSDDELPNLSTLLKRPSQKQLKPALTSAGSTKKDLVPKSPSKSVSRKVRRLESNSQIKGNLLFQRCGPGENGDFGGTILQDSPRKSPLKRRGQAAGTQSTLFPNKSIFGLDDSPPPMARESRTGRSRLNRPSPQDDDSEQESQPDVRIDQLLQVHVPGFPRSQPRQSFQPKNQSIHSPNTSSAKQDDPTNAPTCNGYPNTADGAPKAEADDHDRHVDESSDYCTAEDDSASGHSDGADSEFFSDKSTQSVGNATNIKFLNIRAQRTKPRDCKASSENFVLKPREPNSMNSRASPNLNKQQGESTVPSLPDESLGRTRETFDATTDADTSLDLASQFSKLRLQQGQGSDEENELPVVFSQTNPPRTPSKSEKPKGLASPTKQGHIPKTPHRPSMDVFWNQDFVDEWNEHHSPRKLVLPSRPASPTKASPRKDERKLFDSKKHDIAREFLGQLDSWITEGEIAELAESTGGVKLVWSKTLNTTAGRANWRRETIRATKADGTEVDVKHKHHASIELAEKVIDDENRLLNVLAHEFCHLANFMISGITNNPHGKEFKVWAGKCSRIFGDKGVNVTTKHTYEIAFKYVWECLACGFEHKRHSRSIDPQRHRCGSCKGTLKQTKPAPRGGGKPSEYQAFVKEQMKIVKGENPGKAQKDIMRMVAAKWANKSSSKQPLTGGTAQAAVAMVDLTLERVA